MQTGKEAPRMKHDEARQSVQQSLDDARRGAEVVICDIDAVRTLLNAYEALIRDWSEAVQNAEDIMACNACVHCVVETDDMLCGRSGYGCKPQWRGPEPGREEA